MNGSINVIKFVFAVFVMLCHLGTTFGYDKIYYFQGSFIFVDWFFIFAGFTLAKKILSLDKNVPIAETSFSIIKKRVLAIIPCYYISSFLALIMKLYTNGIKIEKTWDVYKIIHDLLFLCMTGIDYTHLINTEWFLSSLVILLIILTPIFIKHRWLSKICIIFSIILYYYIYTETGNLYTPQEWITLGYKGNIRALAAMFIGFSSYELGNIIKKYLKHPFIENTICMIIYIIIIYWSCSFWNPTPLNELIYFYISYVFMILIAIQMNSQKYILIPDNNFTRFLGSFSMVLYMNHGQYLDMIERVYPNKDLFWKIKYSIIISLSVSLFVYILLNIKNIYKYVTKLYNKKNDELI